MSGVFKVPTLCFGGAWTNYFESYLFAVNNMSEGWQRFLLALLGIHWELEETKPLHFCFKKPDWNEQDYKDFSEENHILWSIICLLTS